MARRRRSRSTGPLKPVLMLVALGAIAFVAWQYGPRAWQALTDGKPAATTTTTELPTPPRQAPTAELDACALAPADAMNAALGVAAVSARHVGAAADVPAAGACTWSAGDTSVVAMVFTRSSLERGGGHEFGAPYFRTVLTGLEYAFKEPPTMLTGVGDEAALIGFGGDSGEPPQVVVRRGERVLHLVFRGVARARAEQVAQRLAAAL